MSQIRWRWEEKDFGFRFRSGKGKSAAEYYQASKPGEYYIVPPAQRKLERGQIDALAEGATIPTGPQVIAIPWRHYDLEWDWIESADGICLNYAGCLHQEEIARREDEGVARAREFVVGCWTGQSQFRLASPSFNRSTANSWAISTRSPGNGELLICTRVTAR